MIVTVICQSFSPVSGSWLSASSPSVQCIHSATSTCSLRRCMYWGWGYWHWSIPDPLYKQLQSSGGLTPLLYGFPKIHKPEVPLRPNVSFINSPSYQLSKHLVHLLSPIVGKTPSFIKNSTDFAASSSHQLQKIIGDAVLVSFDVVSYPHRPL